MAYKIDRVGNSFIYEQATPAQSSVAMASVALNSNVRSVRTPLPTVFGNFGVSHINYAAQTLAANNVFGFGQMFFPEVSEGNSIAYLLEVSLRAVGPSDMIMAHSLGFVPSPFSGNYSGQTVISPYPMEIRSVGSNGYFRSSQVVVVDPGSTDVFCHSVEIGSVAGGSVGPVFGQLSLRSIDTSQFLRPYDPVR